MVHDDADASIEEGVKDSNYVMIICLIENVKLATLVKDNPEAPFSIATTQVVGEGTTLFPELIHFTLDPYLIMLSVKKGDIKLGLNPGLLNHW